MIKKHFLLIALSLYNVLSYASNSEISHKTSMSNKLPEFLYEYFPGTYEHLNVYQKLSDDSLYTKFKISHLRSEIKNENQWRITEGNIVKFDGQKMHPVQQLLNGGENEFVWRSSRPGVGDFTGGYHGDERIDVDQKSKVTFYANNVAINMGTNIKLTPCNSFYYHQFSTMHQTGTGAADSSKPGFTAIPGNPVDSFHEKKTSFEKNGFVTYNKITWVAATPINKCFFGIFSINKDITAEGKNENDQKVIFNENGGNKLTTNKQKIWMKNEVKGISVACDAKIIKLPFTPILNTFIWDNQNYHKYYSEIKATTTNPGDVWETEASISFSYNKEK